MRNGRCPANTPASEVAKSFFMPRSLKVTAKRVTVRWDGPLLACSSAPVGSPPSHRPAVRQRRRFGHPGGRGGGGVLREGRRCPPISDVLAPASCRCSSSSAPGADTRRDSVPVSSLQAGCGRAGGGRRRQRTLCAGLSGSTAASAGGATVRRSRAITSPVCRARAGGGVVVGVMVRAATTKRTWRSLPRRRADGAAWVCQR